MADRRTVDELSIEELEQVLIMRRRAFREERLRRLSKMGRRVYDPPAPETAPGAFPPRDIADLPRRGAARSEPVRPIRRQTWRDRVLLAFEIAAVVGLIAIGASSLVNLQVLNEEVAQAREAPVATATPLIQVSILPGGSLPPAQSDDIPLVYRNLVQPMPAMEIPTPGPEQPVRIEIPSIDVDSVVVQGDSWEDLKKGAGHHLRSANPGERGNMIISAHNDVFGEIFRNLDRVELEDKVFVHSPSQKFEYTVKAKRVVEPTDVGIMGTSSQPVLTLITCYPYLIDTHRLVVIAELKR